MRLFVSKHSKAQSANLGSTSFASNRYDRMEWAGAFGDLGTLIPFVVAYVTLLKIDPFGVLVTFGVGLYPILRTPLKGDTMVHGGVKLQSANASPGSSSLKRYGYLNKAGDRHL